MQICTNCVLPSSFPGIKFNNEGICNYCQSYTGHDRLIESKLNYRQKFLDLLKQKKNQTGYNCLMAYSGGKDSSFALHLLKKEFDLEVLAITFDNGFISSYALNNIRSVLDHLGIDHLMLKPRFDLLKRIFIESSKHDLYSNKALERASTICTSCMGLVKFIILRIAIEKKIPIIAYGWSPGQVPLSASVFKNNPAMLKKMQQAIKQPLHEIVGDAVNNYFLDDRDFENGTDFPYNVSPLAFSAYDEDEIYKTINKSGWQMPEDTDSKSTNCLLNSYANVIHKNRFRYHPYVFEIAKLVREGYLDRIKAISRLNDEENPRTLNFVRKKLFGQN
jgi:predicted PP-loop superfamily ATPase